MVHGRPSLMLGAGSRLTPLHHQCEGRPLVRLLRRRPVTPSTRLDVAVEQLDRHAFRRADEADAHAGPHRGRLAGELDALGLEVGGDGVDAAHREPEMIEAAIWRRRRGIDAVAGFDRGDEDIGAAEFEIDACLTLLHGADHLGAELLLEPLRHRLGIGGAQVDVIPGVFRHGAYSPCSLLCVLASPDVTTSSSAMSSAFFAGELSPHNWGASALSQKAALIAWTASLFG